MPNKIYCIKLINGAMDNIVLAVIYVVYVFRELLNKSIYA